MLAMRSRQVVWLHHEGMTHPAVVVRVWPTKEGQEEALVIQGTSSRPQEGVEHVRVDPERVEGKAMRILSTPTYFDGRNVYVVQAACMTPTEGVCPKWLLLRLRELTEQGLRRHGLRRLHGDQDRGG